MVQTRPLPLIRALAYAKVFATPLPRSRQRVWSIGSYQEVFGAPEVGKKKALQSTLLKQQSALWLASCDMERQQLERSRPLWQEAARAAWWLGKIPWIQSVWVTGSVAAQAVREDDDLDLLLVTDRQRLWLTRLVVVGLARCLRRYRRFTDSQSEAAGQWCLNVWLESSAVGLRPERRNLYTAREWVQAVPIYARRRSEVLAIFTENAWVQLYCYLGWQAARRRAEQMLPARTELDRRDTGQMGFFSFLSEWPQHVLSQLLSVLNRVAFDFQHWYMRPHQTRETVSVTSAFFHPRQTGPSVLTRYETICRQWGVPPWPHDSAHEPS